MKNLETKDSIVKTPFIEDLDNVSIDDRSRKDIKKNVRPDTAAENLIAKD